MFDFFKRKLKLLVQINDNWVFKADGAEDTVVAMFGTWLQELADSGDEPAKEEKEKLPVGFAPTKKLEPTELESKTALEPAAELDLDDEDD